ncbi:zinc finger BED domain-containing protein DAYSLEEPER-like [Rutidosis leptorrhynchoides]|uniref:zinc finger BED domain-containing protein DAYSLEEPER-like n=1 Tax=Rutidosis leptorrhynchoides TaxID=125765 RepID=UPI003A994AB0
MLEYKNKADPSVESDTPAADGVYNPRLDSGCSSFSLHKQKNKKKKLNVNAELSRYLEDEALPDDADILAFWKTNCQYPTLREMAKDLLAIPVSSVASESAFSTGGRVLGHHSRLHSTTVEALMCLQNWKTDGSSVSTTKKSFAHASVFEDSDNELGKCATTDEYEGGDVYMTCNF